MKKPQASQRFVPTIKTVMAERVPGEQRNINVFLHAVIECLKIPDLASDPEIGWLHVLLTTRIRKEPLKPCVFNDAVLKEMYEEIDLLVILHTHYPISTLGKHYILERIKAYALSAYELLTNPHTKNVASEEEKKSIQDNLIAPYMVATRFNINKKVLDYLQAEMLKWFKSKTDHDSLPPFFETILGKGLEDTHKLSFFFLKSLLSKIFTDIAFDTEAFHTVAKVWLEESGKDTSVEVVTDKISKHLHTLRALEKHQHQTSLKLFKNRYIALFGRYSKNLLLEQLSAPEDSRHVLLVVSSTDHSYAIYDQTPFSLLSQYLAVQNTKTLLLECSNLKGFEQITKQIYKNKNSRKRCSSLVLYAHGNPESVVFGKTAATPQVIIEFIRDSELAPLKLPITIVSCGSASGSNSIAQQVSKALNNTVTASPAFQGLLALLPSFNLKTSSIHILPIFKEKIPLNYYKGTIRSGPFLHSVQ